MCVCVREPNKHTHTHMFSRNVSFTLSLSHNRTLHGPHITHHPRHVDFQSHPSSVILNLLSFATPSEQNVVHWVFLSFPGNPIPFWSEEVFSDQQLLQMMMVMCHPFGWESCVVSRNLLVEQLLSSWIVLIQGENQAMQSKHDKMRLNQEGRKIAQE